MNTHTPTQQGLDFTAFKGIEVAMGKTDSCAAIATELAAQYPNHLVLVQSGIFLHGYDKTAYALASLKKYKLRLVGTSADPHLCIGIPMSNYKRRLWSLVQNMGIPYVLSLGKAGSARQIEESDQPSTSNNVLVLVSDKIVQQTITNLQQHGAVNAAATAKLLTDPESTTFQLKDKVQELDTLLLKDILKLPRDLRSTYGETLRDCMTRVLRGVMAYGLSRDKPALLRELSADVDLLKHYLIQSQKLSQLKHGFEHRVCLAVEIGRFVGGLFNKAKP